jgi:1,4-dihydroxy-2-naphthoyl-CoA hydrolase
MSDATDVAGPALPVTPDQFNEFGNGRLPALVGLEVVSVAPGEVTGRLPVRPDLLAPNGYLHAASVVALVDSLCGYGCLRSLPAGATSFTTIELKVNFLGTLVSGAVDARAWLVHGGRTTQVWDAEAADASNGRTLALFRCTQMLLRPR